MSDNYNLENDGALLAARYAFMPNKRRYCGGDKNSEIFGYVCENESDQGLKNILMEFETMYPYLKLIAEANKIFNPFNYRVVEAYWLGNELLENVSLNGLYRHLVDEQKMKKKFKSELMEKIFGKIGLGAKPHHSWHVFNIPKRTGHYPVEHTLETMNNCRIGWGEVVEIDKQAENQQSDLIGKMRVRFQPLVIENNKVKLGELTEQGFWSEANGKAFVRNPKIGDLVSLHWGWVCDLLSKEQVFNLEKWTRYNLNLIEI